MYNQNLENQIIMNEMEIDSLKQQIEQLKLNDVKRKLQYMQEQQQIVAQNNMRMLKLKNQAMEHEINLYFSKLHASSLAEFRQICGSDIIMYNTYVPNITRLVNWLKINFNNPHYQANLQKVNDYTNTQSEEHKIIKIKKQHESQSSSDLTKLLLNLIKQIASQYIDKSDLSEQDNKELELCQDILDAYGIGQTMRDPSKPIMDKLKAFVEAVNLFDKYFSSSII